MENIAQHLVEAMFNNPRHFRGEVEKLVSRNRKLSSKTRRELTSFAYSAIKWRDRLWESEPKDVSVVNIQSEVQGFQSESLETVKSKIKSISLIKDQAHYLSYPTWMLQKWTEDFGLEKAIEIAWVQNQNSDLCVRINGIDETKAQKTFEAEGVETRRGQISSAFYFVKKENIRGSSSFKRGLFEIQDEHSQQVCIWSEPQPKDFIIDGCSRTGGKAFHLADLQHNQGKIICMDIDARVFDELQKRAKRLGVKIIETRWIAKDDSNPAPDLKEKADIVFVDAPCSGTGTIRHNPSSRWALDETEIEKYQNVQQEILNRQSRWVKKGGKLIYITCSLFKGENENVTESFLAKHSEFSLVKQERLFPVHNGGDGFFFCEMKKV